MKQLYWTWKEVNWQVFVSSPGKRMMLSAISRGDMQQVIPLNQPSMLLLI